MTVTYGLIEERYSIGGSIRTAYGLAAYDETETILASVHDITSDRKRLLDLIQKCDRLALSTTHLYDVIDDFLAE